MTAKQKKLYEKWLAANGGKSGYLYKSLPDEDLEEIFLSAFMIFIEYFAQKSAKEICDFATLIMEALNTEVNK